MISSVFNDKLQILETIFLGDIYLKDIVQYIQQTKENFSFPRVLKILTDSRNAEFKFSLDDLETIIFENNSSLENYTQIIDAIIADKPKTTAVLMLYQELEKNPKYDFQVFSTKQAAENWLNIY